MSARFLTKNEMFVLFEIFCWVILVMDNTFFISYVFKHEIFNTWYNLLKVWLWNYFFRNYHSMRFSLTLQRHISFKLINIQERNYL